MWLLCHGVSETQRKGWESLKKMVDFSSPNSRQRLRATARAEWYASVKEEKQNEAPQRAYGGDCVGGPGFCTSHLGEGSADQRSVCRRWRRLRLSVHSKA